MEIYRKAEIFVNQQGKKVHVLTLVNPKTFEGLSEKEIIAIGEPNQAFFGEYPLPTKFGIPYDMKFPIDGVDNLVDAFNEFETQFNSFMKKMKEEAEREQNNLVVPTASQAREVLNEKSTSGLIMP